MVRRTFMRKLFLLALFFQSAPLVKGEMAEKDAAAEILTTEPIYLGTLIRLGADRWQLDLLDRQTEALRSLRHFHGNRLSLAPYLIFFLHYATLPGAVVTGPWPYSETSDETLKEIWPAFAILTETPGIEKILEPFCLDKSNQLMYRVAALEVLKYVDKSAFKKVSEAYAREFHNNPEVITYIEYVASDDHVFWGFNWSFAPPPS